ncbi:hypothetical protein JCM24511_00629 [Saitozyma sp. JCM 24511]|nr:hypothetical protein JCM24511_00629 [Saitozyma sp. JCM 24511]
MDGHAPDIRALLHAVVYPSSNEQYVRDQQILSNLFKQPEFFLALQAYALDKSLSQPERLMASVITGRELKTKWRSKLLVPEARKPEARQRLFSFLEEDDLAIARPQLGLLVAVARIELPRQFPNLPQLLLNPLLTCLSHLSTSDSATSSSSTSTVLLNTLWTINALVKEWRTVKIASGQEVMRTLEEVFFAPVARVLEIWGDKERNGEGDWVIGEAGRYAFKILARFCQWHWSRAKMLQSEDGIKHIHILVHHSVHHAPIIQAHRLRLISHLPANPPAETLKLQHSLYKHLRAMGKWWRVMISIDPKGFCNVQGVTTGIGWWWGEVGGVVAGSDGAVANDGEFDAIGSRAGLTEAVDSDATPYPKRFLLLGMLLFKDIIPILAADHPDIFTPAFVLSALQLLVDKLLPLTSTDLEGLEDEPEEWLIAEDNDEEAWQYEFRPCAERVLMALNNACRHFPREQKVIEPETLKIFHEAESRPPSDLPAILRREAVYCALGRLSRSLSSYGGFDFNAFLTHSGGWLAQGVPLHRILKRRLAWLIGQWVTSEEECAKLPLVWQILVHLLAERGEASDRAVNLSAAVAIKDCVDLWELDIGYFEPYLQQTVQELIKLIGEASTLDGKRYVNDTIGVVIERVGDKIMPFLPTLAQSIPSLWHGAGGLEGEWLFKASLVVLTTKLVSAAKESSGQLMELVIPLIEESLQPPAKEFFEDDGIALWQAGLYNAASPYQPTAETGLIRLLPGLLAVISENLDMLDHMLPLLESYLLLDAPGIVQNHGPAVAGSLAKALALTKPKSDSLAKILATLSLLVRTAPLPHLAPLLLDSGIFHHILTALEDDKASGTILAGYLDVLARIAMVDPNVFLQMVAETARRNGREGDKQLDEVLDALWRNFDYVGGARERKAVAMGAGALLTTGNSHCLERLDGEFMNIFLDVLGELHTPDGEPQATEVTVRPWRDEHPTQWGDIENTPEGARRNALEDADPAFSVPLKAYIIDVLHRAHAVGLGVYWDKADEGTKRSLEKFLS